MPFSPESPETQPVGGAEISALPDGTCRIALATRDGRFGLRGLALSGFPTAAVLVGEACFLPTFLSLGRHLASAGVGALCLPLDGVPGERVEPGLRAARGFLASRGVRRFALAAGGRATAAALAQAAPLGFEALALLSPSDESDPRDLARLRGRPLYVFSTPDCRGADALASAGYAWLQRFEMGPVSATFGEVLGDLAATLVPRLAADVGRHEEGGPDRQQGARPL